MSCSKISRGSTVEDCDLPQGGTRARLILINFSDVLRIYTNDDGKIVQIQMIPGTSGYEFTGFRNDMHKSEESTKTSGNKKRFVHHCGLIIYEVDQLQKLNIRDIAKGRFIAIVESKGQDDDSIELLGRDCGLQIDAGQIRSAQDGGVFTINLSTPDNGIEFEKKLPQTLGTSYSGGLDIIDDLFPTCENPLTDELGNVLVNENGVCITFVPAVDDGIFDDTFDDTFE